MNSFNHYQQLHLAKGILCHAPTCLQACTYKSRSRQQAEEVHCKGQGTSLCPAISAYSCHRKLSRQTCQPLRSIRASSAAAELASALHEHSEEVPDRNALVELGIFGPTHGVMGELKLQASTDSLEDRLSQPGTKWAVVQHPRRRFEPQPVEVEGFRETVSKGRETWLVKVKGVDSPEEAQGLRGHTLMMLAEERPALEDEDEFYVQELIGMEVFMHASKEKVGTVTDVYDGTGTHDIIRVTMASSAEPSGKDPRTALVPFAKEIVPIVERAARRIEIDPPEGLLDIPSLLKTTDGKKKRRRRKERPAERDEPLQQTA